jgi:disulfide bond formation protein DsbB
MIAYLLQRVPPHWLWAALLVAAAVPLCLALVSQYGFGLHPCELCLWQRVPYVLLMLLALLGLAWRCVRLMALIASAAVWASGAGIAAYHVGVEQQWWRSATGCSVGAGGASSLEALRAQIMGAPLVACDEPALVLLGLSMAGWNALYSASMALCMLYVWFFYAKRRTADASFPIR